MVQKDEILGHKLEFFGLILALIGAGWQTYISNWWDSEKLESQYWIQEEVNLAVLGALEDLTLLYTTTDTEKIEERAYLASDKLGESIIRAISMREKRKNSLIESATPFHNFGFFLIALSAILIIVGKYMIYRSLEKNANKTFKSDS
ncbi:hypothetical protein [Vibrio parahaemolyticus]|uniref:hypothetical protein n=1 Tax=Vibrio parahaemolyticus TaxID=670 RepID=UPI00186A9AE0|nr:hypothetical protein [Vibrio parahaemolyticus]EHH1174069.1 hypothetical protein [Vibrio parahaemolyticus]MBE4372857.1 hypothetical protein [Vibrio parahaemolyticus]MBM4851185.1 hypothetical protein [Vibrio parahaemolyticus]HBC3436695.1 hypothetical protein [Vibrio parahaemolyticus]HBH7866809.1 hypothetical protein [Vibrio parahaemolyticus]